VDQASRFAGHIEHPLAQAAPDRLRAAIRAGDAETALAEVDNVLAEAVPIHDMMGDLTAALLTFIAERLGEEAVEEAWRSAGETSWRPFFDAFRASGDVAAFAQTFAAFLHSHRYDFSVVEDDERWVFEVQRGTSGERMLMEGKVAASNGDPAGHHRFGVTEKAYPWTLGYASFPYYDVHSAIWMHLQPREWGWPVIDVEYGVKDHGNVAEQRFVIFKDPAARAAELAAEQDR
jgi:hypothetical protein